MSAKPWWAMTLQWALWSLWMTAMMSWLGRSRLRRRSSADANTLYHPRSTLILGVACLVVFVAFTLFFVVVALASKVTAMGWGTALFAGFALLSASSVLDYFMAFHRISDDGLAYRGMFGRTGSLRW